MLNNSYKLEDCTGSFLSVSLTPPVTIGQIRQCVLNHAFESIKGYDVYRYIEYIPIRDDQYDIACGYIIFHALLQ